MMIASVVQIDTSGDSGASRLRASMVVGATVLALYVYSATPRSIPVSTVYASLALLWAFVVIGGWLGVLFPLGHLSTPAAAFLPDSPRSNELRGCTGEAGVRPSREPLGEGTRSFGQRHHSRPPTDGAATPLCCFQ